MLLVNWNNFYTAISAQALHCSSLTSVLSCSETIETVSVSHHCPQTFQSCDFPLSGPSSMRYITFRRSHGLNLVIQHIPASIEPRAPHSRPPAPLLISLLYCSLIARQLQGQPSIWRHWLLILLDHRKKHVCLWNVRAFLDYVSADRVFFRVLSMHILTGRAFFFFFSCLSVMNPDGKNLFLYLCCSAPHLPLVLIGGWGCAFY